MDFKEKAKSQIRFYSGQIDAGRRRWKQDRITKDKFAQIYRENTIRIQAIQSIFR